jgi:DNA-binding IclR family transcriptional regulator
MARVSPPSTTAARKKTRSLHGGTQSNVQVLDKVVELLDILAAGGELGVAAISEQLGEPRSTVYRLTSSLQQHGLVERGSARASYRLGLKLLELGGVVLSQFDIRDAARPVMEEIHEITGETVFLCVRRGDEAVCIERIDGLHVQSLELRLGGALPLHAGGAPRALLAFEPETEWESYISRSDLRRFTDSTAVDPDELRQSLRDTRAKGYAISDQDVTVGIAAVGAPVIDHSGRVCGALSISGLRQFIVGSGGKANNELILDGTRRIAIALGAESHVTPAYGGN